MSINPIATNPQDLPRFFGDKKNTFEPNALGGIKYDKQKVRPTLMMKSLHRAVASVQDVLEYGAQKYAPDNWQLVEPHRYDDAALRHLQSYLAGETIDSESGKPHLAHALCCIMFRLELDLRKSNPA